MDPTWNYPFKTQPFDHQFEEWSRSREETARAIFWEQGTGKSKLTIDTACWLYMRGLIDGVVVVAPNGVHRNWVEQEILDHVPDPVMPDVVAFQFQSTRSDTKWHKRAVRRVIAHPGFAWFAISYEAFMTAAGKRALIEFFDKRKLLYVLDEAHNIKNPDSKRTASILRSAKYAPYRRVLTGTPIAVGPFDMYSQIEFLDPDFWGRQELGTFVEFKSHFAIFEKGWNPHAYNPKTKARTGAEFKKLKKFRRLDQLAEMIKPISSRVLKEDVLDLPPKVYAKRFFTMTPEQAELYRQLRDEYIVWLHTGGPEKEAESLGFSEEEATGVCGTCHGERELNVEGFIYPCPACGQQDLFAEEGGTPLVAQLAIVRLLRLQQITCGYLPTEDEEEPLYEIPGPNRRLELLRDTIVEDGKKTIVWARFKADIDKILKEMKAQGIRAVRYDGDVTEDGRAEAKALFQGIRPIYDQGVVVGREEIPEEEQATVFVGNPQAGATGLTLTAAKRVIYYSNSFKLIDRLQSEDRAHRIGQTDEVLYLDLVAEGTVDEKIVRSLREKFNVASQITGDRMREWL